MSEKINTDHFSTMEELLEHLKMWERDDDIDSYYRFFCPSCAFELANKIEKQQKEIEELKEKEKNLIFQLKDEEKELIEVTDKIREKQQKLIDIFIHNEAIKEGKDFNEIKEKYYECL